MKEGITTIILLASLLMIGCVHTPKAPPLVLESNKYSYTFGVPEDWDFNFEEARKFDLRLLFFPKGGGFHQSNSIIYIKEVQGDLASAIERVLLTAQNYSPSLAIEIAPSIVTMANTSAQLRILTGSKDPRQAKEALAFIDHGDTIVLVVLTTKNTTNWQDDYKAFETIVAGHRYFDCNSQNLAVPCR